ncbi:B12-binding domain-containing radical SAM protein [Thermodesulfobacteriota bacterium]
MIITFYYLVTDKRNCSVIYNEGVSVLSAIAKEKGWQTSLIMLDLADFRRGFRIKDNVDIHAVSFASQQFILAARLINKIYSEDKGKGLIVVGGVHATVDRESVVALNNVDMVVSGEGEESLRWLLDNYQLVRTSPAMCNIPNVCIKGMPIQPLQKANYVDLNALPYPDRSIFNKALLRRNPEFILSRGCPFSCAYCANEFYNKTFGIKIRRKSPEYCMGELENAFSLLDISKETGLTFHDDVFLLHVNWLHSFSELYKKRFGNPFRCNTTASAVTEDKIKLLKEMNCSEVWVGIETGNEEYRKTVLNKNISNEQIVKAFDAINKYGLKGVSFNILGCPDETIEQVKDTISLNLECKVHSASVAIFVPFPGTTLYEKELLKNNVRELNEHEKNMGVSMSGLKQKNIEDSDYYYWAKILMFKVENKKVLYYAALVLKHVAFSPKILKKFSFLIRYLKKGKIVFDRSDAKIIPKA